MSLRFLESKSGAVVRALASHPCGPGFESWLRRHYVGWACCWFSPLFREVFLRELLFFPLLKNQHFQIPIRSGAHGHVSTSCHELLSAPWVPNYNLQLQLQFAGSKAEYFFWAASDLVHSLPLRIWLWRYRLLILLGELASPCAIALKPSSVLPLPSATGQPGMRLRLIHKLNTYFHPPNWRWQINDSYTK